MVLSVPLPREHLDVVLGRCTSVLTGEATTALDEENENGFWKSMLNLLPQAARSGPGYPYLAGIPDRLLPETVEEMTFVGFFAIQTPSGG